ncbi:hypothetical protein HY78_14660 [Rhizorhabdus wittichii DC-6]|nr:hypothetical protein HY78_14660 [Rhizorhabdus wittichii DC-6]
MTDNASAFIAANARFPIVAGSVRGKGGEGAIYELSNGQTFILSRDDLAAVGMPRWRGMDDAPRNRMVDGAPINRGR